MKQDSAQAFVELLRSRGHRVTEQRKKILEVCIKIPAPFKVQEVVKKVKGANQASVYRFLSLLLEEKIIVQVPGTAEAQYEFSHGHHHHVVCTVCGVTAHVSCEPFDSKRALIEAKFTLISHHEVTLYGVCVNCTVSRG